MSPTKPRFYAQKKYIASHWHFSQCSVDSMKATLQGKACVRSKYPLPSDTLQEMHRILQQQPGQKYTPDQQCVFANGFASFYCG
ncbi:hypothetical protein ACJMK2_007665, partial [Sinanodonta woodiana]